MAKSLKRLKRNKNFKQTEVTILLDLVDKYKDVIECKKISHKDKVTVWLEIERSFNYKSNEFSRDWRTLKGKYENLKKTSKRKWLEEKLAMRGEYCLRKSSINQTDMKLKNILSITQFDEHVSSECDSESVKISTNSNDNSCTNYFPVTKQQTSEYIQNEVPIDPEAMVHKIDINSKSQFIHKTKNSEYKSSGCQNEGGGPKNVSHHLKSKRSPRTLDKYRKLFLGNKLSGKTIESIVKAKEELGDLQRMIHKEQLHFQRAEHELKMNLMKEEHTEKIKLLKLKAEKEALELRMKAFQFKKLNENN